MHGNHQMNKILIIGASGYIGAELSFLLAQEGNKVTALCYPTIPNDEEWCSYMHEMVVADITSENDIDKITTQSFDVAIHLVSLDHHDSNKAPTFVNSVNVMPVWNMLEAFRVKKTLGRFIYFSTIHVYGSIPNKIIDESHITNPQTPYGLTHLLAENICNLYHQTSDIECINVRLSNSYGRPHFKETNCWWLVINDLCKKAFEEKKIILLSDGSPQRDFIHSSDIYQGIAALIRYPKKKDQQNNTYHISSGNTLTILELAYVVKKVYNVHFKEDIQIVMPNKSISKYPDDIIGLDKYIIDNSKLKAIGFMPKINLEVGISEIFNYLKCKDE
jgi:UDP-glucose 4-epimerase